MECTLFKMVDTYEQLKVIILNEFSYSLIGEKEDIIKNDIKIKSSFYYDDDETEVNIDWYDFWKKYYNKTQEKFKTVDSSYGIVLIAFDKSVYCISLGMAYHKLNKLSDNEFSLNVAEQCLYDNDIRLKSSNYWNKSKKKSLTQFGKDAIATYEVGESNDFVAGYAFENIDNKNYLLSKMENPIKFGSAIKFFVEKFSTREILEIVYEFDAINKFDSERKCNLPRLKSIPDNEENEVLLSTLNRFLLNEMLKGSDLEVDLSYFVEENGEIIIKPFEEQNVRLIYDRKSYDISFTINNISKILSEIKCSDITKVSISGNGFKSAKKLLYFLDYAVCNVDGNFLLNNGAWARFNKSYIDFIETEIKNVNQKAKYNKKFDFTKEVYDEGKRIKETIEKTDVNYAEYYYNYYISNKYGYTLLDRKSDHKLFTKVEFADLYDPVNKALIHVKIGDVADFRYCIRQSYNSCSILNQHKNVLETYGIDFNGVEKIVMLFVYKNKNLVKTDSIDFSMSNSVYYKVELIDWLRVVRENNYEPEIIIAFDNR